jgi:hypothetical protein
MTVILGSQMPRINFLGMLLLIGRVICVFFCGIGIDRTIETSFLV